MILLRPDLVARVCAALLLGSALYSAEAADETSGMARSALTSIGAFTSLDAPPDTDDPGAGGGVDTETYFRNRLLPKLEDCTARVSAVFEGWADEFGLMSPKTEVAPGDLLIHATKEGLNGLFELTYRVDANRERARTTVYFYSADGARHEPLAIRELLEGYAIAALQDDLEAALMCGVA